MIRAVFARFRLTALALLVIVGGAALALWAASYAWRPVARFPWPTSGVGQTFDRGFATIRDGRLVVLRRTARLPISVAAEVSPRVMSSAAEALGSPVEPAPAVPVADPVTDGVFPPGTRIAYDVSDAVGIYAEYRVGPDGPPGWGALNMSRAAATRDAARLGEVRSTWGFAWASATHAQNVASQSGALGPPFATVREREAACPLWPVVLVGVATGVWLVTSMHRRRAWEREGRCAGCGYDLRASPARCPECGHAAPVPA